MCRLELMQGNFCGSQSLLFSSFNSYRHDHRRCLIRTFDEFNTVNLVAALRVNGQVTNLPAIEVKGELGAGHIDTANIVREMLAVLEGMVLHLAVLVVKAHDQG